MDFPKSVPGVGLVGGRFVDEDAVAGRVGSLIPAAWGNSLTTEVLNVLAAAGIVPNEASDEQLVLAINTLIAAAVSGIKAGIPTVSLAQLPTTDQGPVFVAERQDIWVWTVTAFWSGYRSPRVGTVEMGHTLTPTPWQLDAAGAWVPKAGNERLLAYAKENALLVATASWAPGSIVFAEESTQIRLPDLRNVFMRFNGTNADTAAARKVGSLQSQAIQDHSHPIAFRISPNRIATATGSSAWALLDGDGFATNPTGGVETRPINVAFAPRIHV